MAIDMTVVDKVIDENVDLIDLCADASRRIDSLLREIAERKAADAISDAEMDLDDDELQESVEDAIYDKLRGMIF